MTSVELLWKDYCTYEMVKIKIIRICIDSDLLITQSSLKSDIPITSRAKELILLPMIEKCTE